MCKLFEINGNGQKDFEILSFSWYYLGILLKNSHRETRTICVYLYSWKREFCALFLWDLTEISFGKTFKVTMRRHFAL